MARILGLFESAVKAASQGESASQFYRDLRAIGAGARRGEVFALFRNAKSVAVADAAEAFRNQQAIPLPSEMGTWPVKTQTGIAQTVTLNYRDKVTGEQKLTYWRTITPNGITREQAVAQAITAYAEHADRYGQDLIGAVHSSARQLVQDPLLR